MLQNVHSSSTQDSTTHYLDLKIIRAQMSVRKCLEKLGIQCFWSKYVIWKHWVNTLLI